MTILKHPAYSLDLAPHDSFLYPKSKEVLRGTYCAGEEVMKKACEGVLKYEGGWSTWAHQVKTQGAAAASRRFLEYLSVICAKRNFISSSTFT